MTVRPAIGTFLKLPRPEVVDILAIAGLDFLVCDTEHGQISEPEVREVIIAGRAARIPVVVRVPALEGGSVNRLLEAGAAGIQLAGVTTKAQAGELGRITRYPPDGTRGVSTAQPAAAYGTIPLPQYLATSNAAILRIGQLESATYADPLDEITAGLDIAFIGVMDLSVDLGVPGSTDAPQVRQRIAEIAAAAHRSGTILGTFAATASAAAEAIRSGCRYVAVGSDLAWLAGAAQGVLAELHATGNAHG